MKYIVTFTALLGYTSAYPSVLEDLIARDAAASGGNVQSRCAWNNYKCPPLKMNAAAAAISAARTNRGPAPCAPFNKDDQYVDTTGKHAFKAPGKSDIRGMFRKFSDAWLDADLVTRSMSRTQRSSQPRLPLSHRRHDSSRNRCRSLRCLRHEPRRLRAPRHHRHQPIR